MQINKSCPVEQSVGSLIADPGVLSLILPGPHTLMEIVHEIFSTVILILPPIQEDVSTEYWLTS